MAPYNILTGQLEMRSDVSNIRERAVEFTDGTVLEDVDVIIYATGKDTWN